MKILTWNVNGIRRSKRTLKDVLDSLDADVICLQETKITRDMLDEPTAIVDGYNAYFSFSRKRSGYSGTASFCRDAAMPVGAEEGLTGQLVSQSEGSIGCIGNNREFDSEELLALDAEGRAIITEHEIEIQKNDRRYLAIINVYVPRAIERGERWTYKQRFLALLQSRAESLLRSGRHVIVIGDINTTHKRIDHCDPSTQEYQLTDSRQWLDQFVRPEDRDPDLPPIADRASFDGVLSDTEGGHFIDAFRFFYPDKTEAYTFWDTILSARQTNFGKRLDYIFVDKGLQDYLVDCSILSDFEGSDHCPKLVELCFHPVPAPKCPPLCTKLMPEFQGKQQKLFSFFSTVKKERAACGLNQENDEAQVAEKIEVVDKEENISDQTSTVTPVLCSSSKSSFFQKEKECVRSPQKEALKRVLPDKSLDLSAKKSKKQSKKGDSVSPLMSSMGKQSSLLTFFQKPSPVPTQSRSTSQTKNNTCQPIVTGEEHQVQSCREKNNTQSNSNKIRNAQTKSLPSKPSHAMITPRSCNIQSSGSADSSSDVIIDDNENKALQQNHKEKESLDQGKPAYTKKTPDKFPESPSKHKTSSAWKDLLSGPPPPPPCRGHGEPCVLRTVRKPGPNKGKQFYVCARPEGTSTNKEARCDHFQWISYASPGKKTSTEV